TSRASSPALPSTWARRAPSSARTAAVTRNPLAGRSAAAPPVVVHMPTGRDAALVADLLGANGHAVTQSATADALAGHLDGEIGTVLLAEEALESETAQVLLERLA